MLGEQRRAPPGVAHHHGGRRVAAGRLVTAGRAARRGNRPAPAAPTRTGRARRRSAHARAHAPPKSKAGTSGASRSAGGPRWHWSCRGRRGRRWRTTGPPGLGRSRPQGQAGRLDPHGRGVLVVGGHGPRPPAAPGAEEEVTPWRAQPPVGDVAGGRGDSTHGRKRSRRRAGSDWPSGADRGREAGCPQGPTYSIARHE